MEQDKLLWNGDLNGHYTVWANVTLLEGAADKTAPWKLLWNIAWEVWWEKILTTEHLKKRGFQLASRCPLCGKAEENLNHLLIHCPSVWSLWEGLIYVPGLRWVWPFTVKDLFFWTSFPVRKKIKNLWIAAPLCLIWAIWKKRNRIVF